MQWGQGSPHWPLSEWFTQNSLQTTQITVSFQVSAALEKTEESKEQHPTQLILPQLLSNDRQRQVSANWQKNCLLLFVSSNAASLFDRRRALKHSVMFWLHGCSVVCLNRRDTRQLAAKKVPSSISSRAPGFSARSFRFSPRLYEFPSGVPDSAVQQNLQVWLTGGFKLLLGGNVSVCGCLSPWKLSGEPAACPGRTVISPTFSWLKLPLPVMLHNEKKKKA